MKTFLIIGMSPFGAHLCREFHTQGCEVMIVDKEASALEPLLSLSCSAKVGDCTKEEVLRSFDIPSFDACFVCVGSDFQSSLEIVSLLSELGAKKVFGKAEDDVQAKFFLRNGADRVIFPARDEARRIAVSESSDRVFDCIPVTTDYSIFELDVVPAWTGHSIKDLDFRRKYKLSILAVKNGETVSPMPGPDYVFKGNEHIMVLGHINDIKKIRKMFG